MKFEQIKRRIGACAAALLVGCIATPASAGETISYVPESLSSGGSAFLVEQLSGTRVRVVAETGYSEGSVSGAAPSKLITLDAPVSLEGYFGDLDSCGDSVLVRQDTEQLIFRRLGGTSKVGNSAVVEIGKRTFLEGCDVGKAIAFGSPSDAGSPRLHRALSLRAPMSDLVEGSLLAGMTRAVPTVVGEMLPADIVEFRAGSTLLFARDGVEVPYVTTTAQWLVLQLPNYKRGYTRLTLDPLTGIETWLQARFAGGKVVTVERVAMVKPEAGASFGTPVKAARKWESGAFVNSQIEYVMHLYRDLTGERVVTDRLDGSESRVAITWRLDGIDLVQRREVFDVAFKRRWVPLLNRGDVRVVMEDEIVLQPGQDTWVNIPHRINFFYDRGRSVKPAP